MKKPFLFIPPLLLGTILLLFSCSAFECAHEQGTTSVIEPTCEREGYTLFRCNDCDYSKKTDILAPTGHELQSTSVPSTCDSEGYTSHLCANCSLQYNTDVTAPKGHSPVKTVTAPTCEKQGFTTYACSGCDFRYTADATAPKGHTLSASVTDPTCEKEGFTTYACACGYSYVADVKAPLGHDYDPKTVAATCTEAGYTAKICRECGHTVQTDFVSPLGHNIKEETVASTCEDAGYTQSACLRCAYTYRSSYLAPLGHTFSLSVTQPTRTASGNLTHACGCGYKIVHPLFYSDVFAGAKAESTEPLAKGIDTSVYQHVNKNGEWQPLNWAAVKSSGFDFAILKAGSTPRLSSTGDAIGGVDPVFEMDYRDAKAAGMELGAYFYTYATTPSEALADANRVISWLKGKQFEYPIYFDLEDPSQEALDKDTLTDICVTFISTLQENGYYAALYANNDWLVNRLHGDILKPIYDIWYARPPYASTAPVSANDIFIWSTEKYGYTLGMWQYTHHGVIAGIDGIEFDFNYTYRDYPSIIKKYGYNGFTVG